MPASIEFLPHGSVLSAEVAATRTPQTKRSTPLQQCVQALLKHCPRRFETTVEHSSKQQKAKLEVTILPSLVGEIPLLADIRSSTTADTTGSQAGNKQKKKKVAVATVGSKASLESGCSILAVVSVLLLHEKLVTVGGWLGDLSVHPLGDNVRDLALAVDTLQMADFLGMRGVRGQVLGWLQTLLHNLAQAQRDNLSEKNVYPTNIASIWHITQALPSIVQPQLCNELFTQLEADEQQPSAQDLQPADLPEEVLCMWLRCQCPTLDFSKFHLSTVQCVNLLHCITLASPEATALHMHGPEDAQRLRRDRYGNATNELQKISIVRTILEALLTACTSLKGLKVLDFTQMAFHVSHVPLLGSIFERLSGSLEELGIPLFGLPGISVPRDIEDQRRYGAEEVQMFFEAIAKLQKLQVLKMPGWEPFVNRACMGEEDDQEVRMEMKQAVSPLLGLPALREVQVPEVRDTLPFTVEPRLKFLKEAVKPCA